MEIDNVIKELSKIAFGTEPEQKVADKLKALDLIARHVAPKGERGMPGQKPPIFSGADELED